MKKKKYFIRSMIVILLLLSIYIINYNSINKKISRDLGVHIPSSLKIEYKDSHGGFLGDGMTLAKANLNDKQIKQLLDKSETKWTKEPMPLEIRQIVSVRYNEKLNDKGDYKEISDINNKYWVFKNRTPQGRLSHITRNYSVAIIDIDTNIFYYVKFDS